MHWNQPFGTWGYIRLHRTHGLPMECSAMLSAALRAQSLEVEEAGDLLYSWFPQGVAKVTDLDVVRPWPAREPPVPWADLNLFPEGAAANQPWKRPRRF